MFIRAELKERAKQCIHRNLWLCIGVTFVYGFIQSGFFGIEVDPYTEETFFRMGLGTIGNFNLDFIYVEVNALIVALTLLVSLIITILILNPLSVGHTRYYIENRIQDSSFETLFFAFNKEHYWNIVKILLLRDVYIILWMLCLIIPGYIKYYEYYPIRFILAENPNMDSEEVFGIAKEMTYGHKFNIFVLEFSFFLWLLLSIVTLGIASLYVSPYMEATYCEAYFSLKQFAIEKGIIAVDKDNETEVIEEVVETIEVEEVNSVEDQNNVE